MLFINSIITSKSFCKKPNKPFEKVPPASQQQGQ